MAKQVKQFERHIEAVVASLEVMDCFLDSPKLTVREIIELTGLTRNRITRILGTLISKGYVMEGAETQVYTPGPKLMALGNVFVANQNLVALLQPVLRELALKTGESSSFYVREGHERVVLAREEGTDPLRFSVHVGQRMDLHAGAAGKVLLAYLPDQERRIIVGRNLPQFTRQTTIDPTVLQTELEQIKKAGFAVSKGERNVDAFAVAVPVFERQEEVVGALSLAGPLSRFSRARKADYLDELLSAARTLSQHFSRPQAESSRKQQER